VKFYELTYITKWCVSDIIFLIFDVIMASSFSLVLNLNMRYEMIKNLNEMHFFFCVLFFFVFTTRKIWFGVSSGIKWFQSSPGRSCGDRTMFSLPNLVSIKIKSILTLILCVLTTTLVTVSFNRVK
jgi:hypothetical protein